MTIKVLLDGQYFGVIRSPEDLAAMTEASSVPETRFSLDLDDLKAHKEAEIRADADRWYRGNGSVFERQMINVKAGGLTPEEAQIKSEMNANYTRLRTLLDQVRGVKDQANWRDALNVKW